jgi:hypothetical protein
MGKRCQGRESTEGVSQLASSDDLAAMLCYRISDAPTYKKEIQHTVSPQIRSAVVPVRRSLVNVGEAKNSWFTSRRASYLHPDWQTLARETSLACISLLPFSLTAREADTIFVLETTSETEQYSRRAAA